LLIRRDFIQVVARDSQIAKISADHDIVGENVSIFDPAVHERTRVDLVA